MRAGERHYTEEELLLHVLAEEDGEMTRSVADHLRECEHCRALCKEFRELAGAVAGWQVPELPQDCWQAQERELLRICRDESAGSRGVGIMADLLRQLRRAWIFALDNPLPTVGYVLAAVAFASERTITVFRMDQLLPDSADLLRLLGQLIWG